MPTSEQLEREATASRERLSQTISELKTRLSPTSMIDEATAYLRRATEEPIVSEAPPAPVGPSRYALPLVLLGAGVAWLAVEARRAERERERRERLAEAVSDDLALAAAAAAIEQDIKAVDVAAERFGAVETVHDTTDIATPVPPMPGEGRTLAEVEAVSIAPVSVREDERREQRSLP